MKTVSIVTPWLNAAELIPRYELSVIGAQPVIVDNGSGEATAFCLQLFCERAGGVYIRNETNRGFSYANNQGLAAATGDIVVFMNNDVECRDGFLDRVRQDVQPGGLYGPSLLYKHNLAYLEGWCIAAYREVWDRLHGWDAEYYAGLYWEDNDLCFRAHKLGIPLNQVYWPVYHHNNYTSRKTPGAYDHSTENERRFLERVRTWQS